ncbi:MAG TPA: hypothetical protein VM778_13950 [Gemmatimonadota bacterium]|nr:hypothetical protein [Gemmatimonadota bacterium]
MDTTIRNLDEDAYRQLKARAALEGKTIGQTVNEAIRAFVATRPPTARSYDWKDLEPLQFPPGNERLSEEIDAIVYGG